MNRLAKWIGSALVAAGCALPLAAQPQSYPSRPIRLVVPIVPGGVVDLAVRRFAQKMTESLSQAVVVENIAGAGGTIGAAKVASAAPDGYTIMWATTGEMIGYLFLTRNRHYDPVKDFTPVMAAITPITLLVAHPSAPGTLKEFIDHARANPGKLAYSSSGIGATFHMVGEMLKSAAGVDILHVPYKGVPQAIAGLASDDVQLSIASVESSRPYTGRIKVLAINGLKRYAKMPGVPSVAEVVPGFEKVPHWFSFFAPAGLPRAMQMKLNGEMNRIAATPEMQQYFDSIDVEFLGGTPEDLAALHRSGIETYAKAAKLAGIKPE